MKTRKTMFGIFTAMAVAIITLTFIACGNGDKETHTHQWEWVETKAATATAEGEETETCATCGQTNRTRPIQKLPEQPQFRETTITLTFGHTAKVQGTLLQAQWTGTADKIETAIDGGYEDGAVATRIRFSLVFTDDVTIIVEKTTEYEKYKVVDGQFRTLYLNVDALDNDLQTNITAAVIAMYEDRPTIDGIRPATKPLTFGTTENPCSVTVTSEETFTTAEWNTLVDKVVAALETAYNGAGNATKNRFKAVFQRDGVTIILEKNPTGYTNYKVGADFNTLYLNVDSVETASYTNLIVAMDAKDPDEPLMIGKASPINIFDFDTAPSAYIKCA